jgi:hypothetical protein
MPKGDGPARGDTNVRGGPWGGRASICRSPTACFGEGAADDVATWMTGKNPYLTGKDEAVRPF